LEQFAVFKIFSFNVGCLSYTFTNSSLFTLIAFFFIYYTILLVFSNALLIPTVWQLIIETFFEFVFYNIVSENVRKDGAKYFPMLFSIFVFIALSNLIGMVPYSFTVTSHIIVTFSLALMFFVAINFIGIRTHGMHLLSLFLPSGAPLAMAPLLVFIELVSYSFRVVSLSLRLFANMMSGHCLLKILAGFA
jgi:ATP synthase subunit 6